MSEQVDSTSLPDDGADPELTPAAQVLPYASGPDEQALRLRRSKRSCLIVMLCGCVLVGALAGLPPESRRVANIFLGAILGFCTVVWMRLDAQERRRRPSKGLLILSFLNAPLGVVLYYLSLREWAGLARAIAFMAALLAVTVIAAALGLAIFFGA